jgi:hypothetical protein
MGKLISIIEKIHSKDTPDSETIKLLNFSNDFDSVIRDAVANGIPPHQVCGIIANRLVNATITAEEVEDQELFEGLMKLIYQMYENGGKL